MYVCMCIKYMRNEQTHTLSYLIPHGAKLVCTGTNLWNPIHYYCSSENGTYETDRLQTIPIMSDWAFGGRDLWGRYLHTLHLTSSQFEIKLSRSTRLQTSLKTQFVGERGGGELRQNVSVTNESGMHLFPNGCINWSTCGIVDALSPPDREWNGLRTLASHQICPENLSLPDRVELSRRLRTCLQHMF